MAHLTTPDEGYNFSAFFDLDFYEQAARLDRAHECSHPSLVDLRRELGTSQSRGSATELVLRAEGCRICSRKLWFLRSTVPR